MFDRELLERWVRSSTTQAGLAQRARIVLLAADGVAHVEISRQTVINWRARDESLRVAGLYDEDRSGRRRALDRDKLITTTLTPPPKKYGVTHWSSRLRADHLGIGYGTVAWVWREHGVALWRTETFKFSTNPELVAKVTDIVGLYLKPPQNAIVLCVDEKSQIQALDRTAPTLPMQIGMPERQTRDYVRHGTPPRCSPRWRSPLARSPESVGPGTVTRSFWCSSNMWHAPTPTRTCIW